MKNKKNETKIKKVVEVNVKFDPEFMGYMKKISESLSKTEYQLACMDETLNSILETLFVFKVDLLEKKKKSVRKK